MVLFTNFCWGWGCCVRGYRGFVWWMLLVDGRLRFAAGVSWLRYDAPPAPHTQAHTRGVMCGGISRVSVEDAVRLWLVRVWGVLVRLGVGVGGLRYHAPGTAYTGTYRHIQGPEETTPHTSAHTETTAHTAPHTQAHTVGWGRGMQ